MANITPNMRWPLKPGEKLIRIISHRGNLSGPDLSRENKEVAISECILLGLDVEIDIWLTNKEFYLGHDQGENLTSENFLIKNSEFLWVHCKNTEAFEVAIELNLNAFMHTIEPYVITTKGYYWAFPGMPPLPRETIACMPELSEMKNLDKFYGVCTDFVDKYRAL